MMIFYRFERFIFLVAFCFMAVAFVSIRPVRAFAVSPAIVELEIEPAVAQSGTVRVTNTQTSPATYFLSVQNFVSRGEEGQQNFLPETDRTGLASWLIPQANSVTLQPGEVREFGYTVSVPKEAEPGGHYAALFFSTRPSTPDGGSVGVGAKTGIIFLLRVPGGIREDARIESFRVTPASANRLPVHFELRVRNLGNVHVRPEGQVVIRNFFGLTATEVSLNPQRVSVLPQGVRRLETRWAAEEVQREGGFLDELRNEWNHFAFGRYTAEVQAVYGHGQLPLHAKTTFWIFPWRLLSVGLAFIVLLGFLIRRYNRRILKAAIKGRGIAR